MTRAYKVAINFTATRMSPIINCPIHSHEDISLGILSCILMPYFYDIGLITMAFGTLPIRRLGWGRRSTGQWRQVKKTSSACCETRRGPSFEELPNLPERLHGQIEDSHHFLAPLNVYVCTLFWMCQIRVVQASKRHQQQVWLPYYDVQRGQNSSRSRILYPKDDGISTAQLHAENSCS